MPVGSERNMKAVHAGRTRYILEAITTTRQKQLSESRVGRHGLTRNNFKCLAVSGDGGYLAMAACGEHVVDIVQRARGKEKSRAALEGRGFCGRRATTFLQLIARNQHIHECNVQIHTRTTTSLHVVCGSTLLSE